MYSLSQAEKEEMDKIERELFFSNGVLRYTNVEVKENVKIQNLVLRLQYLYAKFEELHFASCN